MSVEGMNGGLLGGSPLWKPDTAGLQCQGGGLVGQGRAVSLAAGKEKGLGPSQTSAASPCLTEQAV